VGEWGLRAAALGAIAHGLVACAAGADADGDNFGPPPSTVSAAPGDGTDGSTDTGDAKEASDDGEPPAEESSDSAADDTAGTSGGGSTGEPLDGSGSDSGDDGMASMCENDLTCASAEPIGGVAGDESTPQIVVSGDTPTWVAFQVSENNADVSGEKLSFTVTLQSPVGADFDLYVHRGAEGGASGCGGTMMQSINAAGSDSVSMEWGEGTFANNGDDGVWVAAEIRAKNGTCAPPAEWTLTVAGDT
jgi:hypothetical protein